jgi:hypothetical protein
MRTQVKETPENRGIISLRGTLNPATFPRAGLMPRGSSNRPGSL